MKLLFSFFRRTRFTITLIFLNSIHNDGPQFINYLQEHLNFQYARTPPLSFTLLRSLLAIIAEKITSISASILTFTHVVHISQSLPALLSPPRAARVYRHTQSSRHNLPQKNDEKSFARVICEKREMTLNDRSSSYGLANFYIYIYACAEIKAKRLQARRIFMHYVKPAQ